MKQPMTFSRATELHDAVDFGVADHSHRVFLHELINRWTRYEPRQIEEEREDTAKVQMEIEQLYRLVQALLDTWKMRNDAIEGIEKRMQSVNEQIKTWRRWPR